MEGLDIRLAEIRREGKVIIRFVHCFGGGGERYSYSVFLSRTPYAARLFHEGGVDKVVGRRCSLQLPLVNEGHQLVNH